MKGFGSGREAGDNYTSSTPQSRNYTSSTPQANCVESTPSRGKGRNFSTSTPMRQDSSTPEAPQCSPVHSPLQWSPHQSQAVCGARGESLQVQSTVPVARQHSLTSGLDGSAAQMLSTSVEGGYGTPFRPQNNATVKEFRANNYFQNAITMIFLIVNTIHRSTTLAWTDLAAEQRQ